MTALHHAIAHASCLELLIEKGAKIDHTDTSTRTALFYAAKNNCEEGCRFLISKGASLDIQGLKQRKREKKREKKRKNKHE